MRRDDRLEASYVRYRTDATLPSDYKFAAPFALDDSSSKDPSMGDADEKPVTDAWEEALRADIEKARKTLVSAGFLRPDPKSGARLPGTTSTPVDSVKASNAGGYARRAR
jgi:hypothetical protein